IRWTIEEHGTGEPQGTHGQREMSRSRQAIGNAREEGVIEPRYVRAGDRDEMHENVCDERADCRDAVDIPRCASVGFGRRQRGPAGRACFTAGKRIAVPVDSSLHNEDSVSQVDPHSNLEAPSHMDGHSCTVPDTATRQPMSSYPRG